MIRAALVALLACIGSADAAAASKSARCERYREQLAQLEEARREAGGNKARLHKLEAKRQKILAGQAKHHC